MKLSKNPMIRVLAADLGVRASEDPVEAIRRHCQRQIQAFIAEYGTCNTLSELLILAASKLRTRFHEVRSDSELRELVREQVNVGETGFASLETELASDAFGVTLKRRRPVLGMEYCSIIDCRGEKAPRAYFTKWHELGHLLILTDQRRLVFRRTHSLHEEKSPEETLVDVIAGEFAYHAPIVKRYAKGQISFALIEQIRTRICPEGSMTSALYGISKAWPTACVVIEARMAFKKGDGDQRQQSMPFVEEPRKALRAVHVSANDLARQRELMIPRNFRVPKGSAIWKTFVEQVDSVQTENLNAWVASDGTRLSDSPIRIEARPCGDVVFALLTPNIRY